MFQQGKVLQIWRELSVSFCFKNTIATPDYSASFKQACMHTKNCEYLLEVFFPPKVLCAVVFSTERFVFFISVIK